MIKSGSFPGDDEVSRFQTEAEVVARLRHPHIVQIFEVGNAGRRNALRMAAQSSFRVEHSLTNSAKRPCRRALRRN